MKVLRRPARPALAPALDSLRCSTSAGASAPAPAEKPESPSRLQPAQHKRQRSLHSPTTPHRHGHATRLQASQPSQLSPCPKPKDMLAVEAFGRTIDADDEDDDDDVFRLRRQVLRETVGALASQLPHYRAAAAANLARWREAAASRPSPSGLVLRVEPGDWGEVTGSLVAEWGVTFAVLNMANAYSPGGGYVEGCPAQEENMFRRTDCHFSIRREDLDEEQMYRADASAMLNAEAGAVYLDTRAPRVCVRGCEDRAAPDLGYRWLRQEEVFPFFELRAAAQDLRGDRRFSAADARRRIAAQLETLRAAGVRHAVLSAFGCGAFANPAAAVARLYREEVEARAEHFDCIVFAIFAPGYGPDNYTPFKRVFAGAADV